MICLKSGKFATFVFLSFQLKLQYLICSKLVISENNHALPENIALMYSKVILNLKFTFSRKYQSKSVCIRRFLRFKYSIWGKGLNRVKCNS